MDMITPNRLPRYQGIVTAISVMSIWLGVLLLLLGMHPDDVMYWIVPGIPVMTFLYTGLFITAHDAMHNSIAYGRPGLNAWVGRLAVAFYAAFSWQRLLSKHSLHHKYPASQQDPDFHAQGKPGFWAWYFHFMLQYVTLRQLLSMAIIFNVLHYVAGFPVVNLVLFWVTPSLLSTLQLFYFGTFLPHRERDAGYPDQHRAYSNDFSVLWSFLSCYHFGYHWEHHQYPFMPWWSLPMVRNVYRNH